MWISEDLKSFLFTQAGFLLLQDVKRWFFLKRKRQHASTDEELLVFLEWILGSTDIEFRNIVDYRLSQAGRNDLCPNPEDKRADTLFIKCKDIGGGLFVQHGHSTIILSQKIGKNFWVNQNVTIGDNGNGSPIIGNNVAVRTGAVVVGPLLIGNNVTITANAVVSFDVPDGATVYAPRSVIVLPK